jgi:predicted nucleic acid-binding protein
MAQLSIPPWQDLYDATTNNVVETTTYTTLNGKLYAKLLVSLEGQALQAMFSRKHIRANGLLLLKELIQTYKPRNVPEVIATKTGEFWSNMKRAPHETIDAYYNRLHELLDDLTDAYEPIATKSAIRHFIFTFGSDFDAVQNNFRLGNLPTEWTVQDWPSILVLCRDYYNSIHPQGIPKKDNTSYTPGMS